MPHNLYIYGFCLLGILIPVTLVRRLLRNKTGALLNPLFYLMIFSYLYLLLPSFYIEWVVFDLYNIDITEHNFVVSQYMCLWYLLVFYIFYLISKDNLIIRNDTNVYKGVYQASLAVYFLIILLLLWIIATEVPHIYAARGDRGEALGIYYERVLTRYRIAIVTFVMLGVTAIIILQSKKLIYLAPLLLFCLIDYSHGGRTLTFLVFVFSYINIVLLKHKLYLKYAIPAVVAMILAGILQRYDMSTLLGGLYMAGAEFSNTRITTSYVIGHPEVHGNIIEYFFVSVSRLLPGGILSKLVNPTGEWYGDIVSSKVDIGFGLAGNLVTESVYYGGMLFGVISPLIIGGIYYSLNYFKVYKNLIGFVFVLFLCAKTQEIMRTYFYDHIFYLLGIEIFYLFFILFEFRKKFFV